MDFDQFSPSLLYSFNDHLLNFAMLLLVRKCVFSEYHDPKKNFFLSPIIGPEDILKKFPKTYIMICELDPLHDGGLIFALRLLKSKVPCRIY